jgi:ribosomal protein S18 acetylase RimI-like enzyme
MPEITFRFAQQADAADVTSVVNAAYSGPESHLGWTPETHLHAGPRTTLDEVATILASPAQRIILCLAGGRLAGSVQIGQGPEDGYLGMLAVSPRQQAMGLGKALMDEAERQAGKLWACSSLTLSVISLQTALAAFYRRRGYVPTGRREPFPHEEQLGALRFDFDLIYLRKAL